MAKAARRSAVVLAVLVMGTAVALVASALPAAASPAASGPVPSAGGSATPIVEHYQCTIAEGPPRWFAADLTVTGSVPASVVVPESIDVSGMTVTIPAWLTGGGPGASITDVSYVVRVATGGTGAEITDPGGPVSPSGVTTSPAATSLDVFTPATSYPTAIPVSIGDVSFTVHAVKDGTPIDRRMTCDIGDNQVTRLGVVEVQDPVLVGVALVRADLVRAASSLARPSSDLARAAANALGVETGGAGGLLRLGANEPAVRAMFGSAALLQEAIDLGSTGLVGDRHRLASIGEEIAERAIEYHLDLHGCNVPDVPCDPFIVAQVGFQRRTISAAEAVSNRGLDVLALAAYHDVVSHDF